MCRRSPPRDSPHKAESPGLRPPACRRRSTPPQYPAFGRLLHRSDLGEFSATVDVFGDDGIRGPCGPAASERFLGGGAQQYLHLVAMRAAWPAVASRSPGRAPTGCTTLGSSLSEQVGLARRRLRCLRRRLVPVGVLGVPRPHPESIASATIRSAVQAMRARVCSSVPPLTGILSTPRYLPVGSALRAPLPRRSNKGIERTASGRLDQRSWAAAHA